MVRLNDGQFVLNKIVPERIYFREKKVLERTLGVSMLLQYKFELCFLTKPLQKQKVIMEEVSFKTRIKSNMKYVDSKKIGTELAKDHQSSGYLIKNSSKRKYVIIKSIGEPNHFAICIFNFLFFIWAKLVNHSWQIIIAG